eukprot:7522896-Alexandrium_andersonii.AAC.1
MLVSQGKDQVLTSVDVTQQADRCFLGWDGMLPTVTPGAKVWLTSAGDAGPDRPRVMTGREALAAQAFPVEQLSSDVLAAAFGESPTDGLMQDLAGNAFC